MSLDYLPVLRRGTDLLQRTGVCTMLGLAAGEDHIT